jgi:ribosomal protein S27AE
MHCYVSKTMEVEEYQKLSDDELFDIIKTEMWVDEGVADSQFHHKELAQYLERAAYYCPDCGLSVFESEKDIITCKKCGRTVRYMPDKTLQGVDKEFPYQFYADWYDAQSDYINSLDVLSLNETPLFVDNARFSEVILYENKKNRYYICFILLCKCFSRL